MPVEIDRDAILYLNNLPEKDRRIIKRYILTLENPRSAKGVELLANGHCRMHVGRTHTISFDVLPGQIVRILEIRSIEQAHKRYKR